MEGVSAVPVPQPRARTAASASGAAPDSAGSRRSLAAGLLLGAAGATVVLLASGQTWAEGDAATGGGALPLTVDGQDVTGVPAALAAVGLAALVAVFAVRGAGRRIVAALLALSGLGATLSAWAGGSDSTALDEEAARTTGDAAATIHALSHTAWPYVTAAGGLLILLAGLLALRYGSRWPAMSGKYERDGTPAPARRPAPPPTRTGPRTCGRPWTAARTRRARRDPTLTSRGPVRDNGPEPSPGRRPHVQRHPQRNTNEEQLMAGSSHGHTPAAWTGVIIAFIGFCVAGVFMVAANPLGFWAGIAVIFAGGLVGLAMKVAGLGMPKESAELIEARERAGRAQISH